MICDTCHRQYIPGAKKCPHCGALVGQNCPKCGSRDWDERKWWSQWWKFGILGLMFPGFFRRLVCKHCQHVWKP